MLLLDTSLALHTTAITYFKDITGTTSGNGYGEGGNITYSDVEAIRIKVGTYSTIEFPAPPDATGFTQYTEYIKISGGSETIDGKVMIVGSIFVPQSAGITTTTPEDWETTGYYVYPYLATWLPIAAEVPLSISVAQLGQTGDNVEDNIYSYGYENYYDLKSTSFTSVSGATYMVLTGTATYLADVYRTGEVFLASDASTITISASTVVRLYAATSGYAALVPAIETDLNDLIELQIGKNNQDLVEPTEGTILKIRTKLEALEYAAQTQNVSLLYSYETIQYLQSVLDGLLFPQR